VSIKLRELADWVRGELVGDGETAIDSARSIADARPGDITLAADERHLAEAHHCPASAAVVPRSAMLNGKSCIRVDDPLAAFISISERMQSPRRAQAAGIHPRACVHPSAVVGDGSRVERFAVIGPGAVIGRNCQIGAGVSVGADCRLGDDVILHPHVTLYDGTQLGSRVIIHANSVIGADGFGYRPKNGALEKVPQFGCVEIGDDVEIGACSTIDRGTFGATRIGAGTKIDNLVQIAHNCQIGRHNVFTSQCGIAGSSSTGDYVIVAGQAGIVDHVHIGTKAIIGAQSGITKDVPDGANMLGSPATSLLTAKRIMMTWEKLPQMRRQLEKLLKHAGIADEE
jgi:UDP-3-O-[3-hydroxymyristoyl] glucosamine N-acyltransferase